MPRFLTRVDSCRLYCDIIPTRVAYFLVSSGRGRTDDLPPRWLTLVEDQGLYVYKDSRPSAGYCERGVGAVLRTMFPLATSGDRYAQMVQNNTVQAYRDLDWRFIIIVLTMPPQVDEQRWRYSHRPVMQDPILIDFVSSHQQSYRSPGSVVHRLGQPLGPLGLLAVGAGLAYQRVQANATKKAAEEAAEEASEKAAKEAAEKAAAEAARAAEEAARAAAEAAAEVVAAEAAEKAARAAVEAKEAAGQIAVTASRTDQIHIRHEKADNVSQSAKEKNEQNDCQTMKTHIGKWVHAMTRCWMFENMATVVSNWNKTETDLRADDLLNIVVAKRNVESNSQKSAYIAACDTLDARQTTYTITTLNELWKKPTEEFHINVTNAIKEVETEVKDIFTTEGSNIYLYRYLHALGILEAINAVFKWCGGKFFKEKPYAIIVLETGFILQRQVVSAEIRQRLLTEVQKAIHSIHDLSQFDDTLLKMEMVVQLDQSAKKDPAQDTSHYCEQHQRTLQAEHRWKTLTEQWSTYPHWIEHFLWDRMCQLALEWQSMARIEGKNFNKNRVIGAIAGVLLETYGSKSNEELRNMWESLAARSLIQRKENMACTNATIVTIKTSCMLEAWKSTDDEKLDKITQCANDTPHNDYINKWVRLYQRGFGTNIKPPTLAQRVNVLKGRLTQKNKNKVETVRTLAQEILTLLPAMEQQPQPKPQLFISLITAPSALENSWDDMADITQKAAELIYKFCKDDMQSRLARIGEILTDITFHGMTQTYERLHGTDLDVSTSIKQKWKQWWNMAELLTNDDGRAKMTNRLDQNDTPSVLQTLFQADVQNISDCVSTHSSFVPGTELQDIVHKIVSTQDKNNARHVEFLSTHLSAA